MIEISGRYYFIDMGFCAIDDLVTRGIPVENVKAVFVTHHHGDHTDGLLPFIDLISWYYKNANPAVYLSTVEQGEIICSWIKSCGVKEVRTVFNEVKPGLIFDDGYFKVTAFPTMHCDRSYSFMIEAEGKCILFTGDLAHPDKDFPQIIRQRRTDLVVCEGAHFLVDAYLPLFKQCDIQKVIVNHYNIKNISRILQMNTDLPNITVSMANDGTEISL